MSNEETAGHGFRAAGAGALVFCLLTALSLFIPFRSHAGPPSIKFSFSFDRFYGDHFNAPAGIFVDRKNREIYLADSGRKELFIFDAVGTPLFRIGRNSGISSPLDMVVRSNLIYLSQEGKGSIDILSYKGDVKGSIEPRNVPFSPGRMTLDNKGNIYVINKAGTNCRVFDKDDRPINTIGEGLLSITDVAVADDRIYLITPFDSRAVHVYDMDGRPLMRYEGLEERGGTLSLPISATVDRLGLLWLLDALKGIIVYDKKGMEVARFNLIGPLKGQLLFPVEIDIDDDDRLYVAEKEAKRVTVYKIER